MLQTSTTKKNGLGASSGNEFAVGCILSIKTALGDEFQGQVVTFDRPSNILVLLLRQDRIQNIRPLKANYIKEFSFLGQGEDPLDLKKRFLDLNALQAREESAIRNCRQAEIEAERFGIGVSAEAKSIFYALSKT